MENFNKYFGFAGEYYDERAKKYSDEQVGYHYENYLHEINHISSNFNAKMAEVSLCIAMASFNSYASDYAHKNYDKANQNIDRLWNELGTSHITYYKDYGKEPSEDTAAAAVCIEQLSPEEALVVLVIRGGGYEDEWLSNMTIGRSGIHEGFYHAANSVIQFLQGIIRGRAGRLYNKMKLWVTGYSRGGAIANVTGYLLNQYAAKGALGKFLRPDKPLTISQNDFYVYCFEPPFTTSEKNDKALNNNIFNILNPTDIVTQVPPAKWGFQRYGNVKNIPTPTASNKNVFTDMCELYLKYVGKDKPTAGANSYITYIAKYDNTY